MKKTLFVFIGVLVSYICFAQSSFVIYDNTSNDQLTTFQISNGETVGDEVIMAAATRPPYNVNYFSFTYWGENFGGDEQMKVLFYKNDGTDGKPNSVLWDSDWFGIPETTKSQVIFDSGLSVPLDQQTFTWAVSLNGLDTGESAGLWIYTPPTVGNNYRDYWYKDGSGWQLRAGAQAIDFEAKIGSSDVLPTGVTVTAPLNDANVVAGSSVVLSATATDSDGWIQKIEFFVDGVKVGEDVTPPFSINWDAGSPADVSITAKAYDNLNQSAESGASTIHIVVNTAPSFTKGADISVSEDAGLQTIVNWATTISPGQDYESGQTLTFLVSNNNNALFSQQPAISSDGTLTFQSAPDANGSAIVTVALQDDGGTLGGGDDTSDEQTFNITVTPVNDAPVAQNVSANTSEETQTQIELVATDVDGDPLTYEVVLLPVHGTVNSIVGNIVTYTPATDYNGTDTFTYKAYDGTAYSTPATVTISISAVNDVKPSYFAPAVNYATDTTPVAVAVGDFVRDGKKDFAVACEGSYSINIFKGTGAGVFVQVNNIPVNGTPVAMVSADFNLDGKVDIAVAVQENKIIFLYNMDNQGNFSSSEMSLTFTPIGLITDRFDGDARPDLATLSAGPNTLNIIYNGGTLLQPFNVGGTEIVALASGDFNRDGRKDIAIVDKSENKVRIMKQLPDKTFTTASPSAYNVGDSPNSICFADFNGDRYDDIAVGNVDTISILLAKADGTFVTNQTVSLGLETSSLAASDLDKDGIKELIVATVEQLLIVLKGASGGTFAYYSGDPNIMFAIGEGQKAMAIDELNNDSSLDAVVANSDSGNISILLNNRVPKVYSANYITLEDTPVDVTLRGSYGPLDYMILGTPIYGLLELKSGYSLSQTTTSPIMTYIPTPDIYGYDYFYFMASDGIKPSSAARITVRVKSVNDQPSFDLAQGSVTVDEDSGITRVDDFVINVNKGAENEVRQVIRYIISNDNLNLFQRQPSINYLGALTFMPKKNAYGSANILVYAMDSGGTLDGGINTSEPKLFTINIENINDPPVISRLTGTTYIFKNTAGAFQVFINDVETPAADLDLTVTSSVQEVISDSDITKLNYGGIRVAQFTPVPDVKGRTLLTFTVSDGTNTTSKSTWVTVR